MASSRIGLVILGLLAAGCDGPPAEENSGAPAAEAASPTPTPAATPVAKARWRSGGASVLRLVSAQGARLVELSCPAGSGEVRVNVPEFEPIGSEERMSFGAGATVVALVANTRGDAKRGGVTGAGEVPPELPAILTGPISIAYGAQASGPHPGVGARERAAFLKTCRKSGPTPAPSPSATASACEMQDGRTLTTPALRAVGTEPFWGARIEGRCVTYSTPEDQAGTRVWTRYASGARGSRWAGKLGGVPFVLRTRRAAGEGCSDGMSDRRYAWEVTLRVRGEIRRGCAEDASLARGER